ncbi:hypothetical protein C8R45DRAFT_1075136 [Mycena sanguinolenta]|nr:hypothetical protein C8R45DRAFT_1075136 [Mycena sanguinolenta]
MISAERIWGGLFFWTATGGCAPPNQEKTIKTDDHTPKEVLWAPSQPFYSHIVCVYKIQSRIYKDDRHSSAAEIKQVFHDLATVFALYRTFRLGVKRAIRKDDGAHGWLRIEWEEDEGWRWSWVRDEGGREGDETELVGERGALDTARAPPRAGGEFRAPQDEHDRKRTGPNPAPTLDLAHYGPHGGTLLHHDKAPRFLDTPPAMRFVSTGVQPSARYPCTPVADDERALVPRPLGLREPASPHPRFLAQFAAWLVFLVIVLLSMSTRRARPPSFSDVAGGFGCTILGAGRQKSAHWVVEMDAGDECTSVDWGEGVPKGRIDEGWGWRRGVGRESGTHDRESKVRESDDGGNEDGRYPRNKSSILREGNLSVQLSLPWMSCDTVLSTYYHSVTVSIALRASMSLKVCTSIRDL